MKILLWLCVLVMPSCFALFVNPLTTVLSHKSCILSYILLSCTESAYRLTEDTAHTFKKNIVVRVSSFLLTDLTTHLSEHLQWRDQRTKCSFTQWLINAHSLSESVTKHDGLSICVMKLPESTQKQVNIFMLREIKIAESVVHNDTVLTATYYRFDNEVMSLTVSELCGCTTLVIVFCTAVYFNHTTRTCLSILTITFHMHAIRKRLFKILFWTACSLVSQMLIQAYQIKTVWQLMQQNFKIRELFS